MSHAAYRAVMLRRESPRDAEIRVIGAAIRRLEAASAPDAHPSDLLAAVNTNCQVWQILRHELSRPNNPLPDVIRTGYIGISLAVERACAEVAAGTLDALEQVAEMIRINRDLLEGLCTQADRCRG